MQLGSVSISHHPVTAMATMLWALISLSAGIVRLIAPWLAFAGKGNIGSSESNYTLTLAKGY